jgi:methionyl-tRNA formyltransferase
VTPTGPSPRPVRTVFIGSGRFGVPTLGMLAGHSTIELVGVVTAPPRTAGRQLALTATPVAEAAQQLGIEPILTPARLRDADAVSELLGLDPSLVILADYGQIVPAALLDLPLGALNLHPSLLPRHRGATPIPAAILAGDPETGVSLMRMDEGLDTGPVVAVERIDLDGTEVAPELEDRLAVLGASLLERSIEPWLAGDIDAHPQAAEGATLTRPLRREDGRLEPAWSAPDLERQVRAYQPWPGSFVDTPSGRLVVWRAIPDADAAGTPPGVFDAVGLGTGHGDRLQLVEVQPAGGKRMAWDEFVRGRPGIIGSAVVPVE